MEKEKGVAFSPMNGELIEIDKKSKNISVFISHDARDKEIAIAFGDLIKECSITIIDNFCSSREGDIDYGEQWFKRIMKEIENASNVVCLFTPHSVKKPWILYEAGVANGIFGQNKVIGIAIGIKMNKFTNTPFSQFQICQCDAQNISNLMKQLLKEIPQIKKPIDLDEHIQQYVNCFIEKIQSNGTR